MPQPEFPLAKREPMMFAAPAETIPPGERGGYTAYVNFGGLFITAEAPCGCKMHYDTTSVALGNQNSNCLEPCMREDCAFEYGAAETAAIAALREFVSHGPDYDLGGEG